MVQCVWLPRMIIIHVCHMWIIKNHQTYICGLLVPKSVTIENYHTYLSFMISKHYHDAYLWPPWFSSIKNHHQTYKSNMINKNHQHTYLKPPWLSKNEFQKLALYILWHWVSIITNNHHHYTDTASMIGQNY